MLGDGLSLDYRLDELGWYQFERLCQALLRSRHGAALEAWGGGSDFGRDAYADGPLYYPDPKRGTEGPFVFQVKFVAGANATGANWASALTKGVQAELKRIDERIDDNEWDMPAVYTLMTNAPVSATARERLKRLIQSKLPDSRVFIHSATDIAADLDSSPQVRMAYPQILGLRDLQALLARATSIDVITRSNVAIEMLADLAQVFVATEAYNTTLRVLDNRAFAVLTGPPEMGKTATAWMIALARLSGGWEVFDCRGPQDLFRVYDSDRAQLFVADDAFGSTEYRPEIAAEWAAQLSRVVRIADRTHWVIWTSRPGPLRTGLDRLHLEAVTSFPDPHQVVVDASRLSIAEKAQILYRHAKAAQLPEAARNLIRKNARLIVQSSHFTPLRIRRLVRQQLTEVLLAPVDKQTERLREAVSEGLRAPTSSMRTSFNVLPSETKFFLIAMLNEHQGPISLERLSEYLQALQGGAPSTSVAKLAEHIEDHFVRLAPFPRAG